MVSETLERVSPAEFYLLCCLGRMMGLAAINPRTNRFVEWKARGGDRYFWGNRGLTYAQVGDGLRIGGHVFPGTRYDRDVAVWHYDLAGYSTSRYVTTETVLKDVLDYLLTTRAFRDNIAVSIETGTKTMGTDIHAWVEVRSGDVWEIADDMRVVIGRSYLSFGILCGVRGWVNTPIAPARGIPPNSPRFDELGPLTEGVADAVFHNGGWVSLLEMMEYDWDAAVREYGVAVYDVPLYQTMLDLYDYARHNNLAFDCVCMVFFFDN